jgi:hypothetical protein
MVRNRLFRQDIDFLLAFFKKGEEAAPQVYVPSRTGRKLRSVQNKRPTIDFVYSESPA